MKTSFQFFFALLLFAAFCGGCAREGCTDPTASNYNSKATKSDGSCRYANVLCNATDYSGSGSCSSGYVAVTPTSCCPKDYPYVCSSTNKCYSSCEDAQAVCNYPTKGVSQGGSGGSAGYKCSGGSCSYVSSGASYTSLTSCQSSCSSSSAGYVCSSGTCTYVSSGASYTSLSSCQSSCGSSSAGYNCNGSSCYSVSSGASYSTLSSCQNSCKPSCVGAFDYYGNNSGCGSGYLEAADGIHCCASTNPYWCSSSNTCYSTCPGASSCSGSLYLLH